MSWFAEFALLPSGLARDVRFEVHEGRFTSVQAGVPAGDAVRLPGVVLPGLANGHSHAFHRALRGRTSERGTFWTWRSAMYAVAQRLDPDLYRELATAVFAEMAAGGVSTVGEFHYLHHQRDGRPYADPNEMAESLRQGAADAGVRLTLLDTCYLSGGLEAAGHQTLDPTQRRFADADVDAWAERVDGLTESAGMKVGVAVHSVRAVPRPALSTVAAAAAGRPVHVHLSEQPAENSACQAYYGLTPTALLDEQGLLGPGTTAVHCTHLDYEDLATLGRRQVTACICPTTEADLADGIGPARQLNDAGCPLALGSDQNTVVDLLVEARSLEMHERLASGQRGRFDPAELLAAATAHSCLGWRDAGVLAAGARADLVAIRLDSPRTAGVAPEQVLLAASAPDVDTVVVDGRVVLAGGVHRLGDIGLLLREVIDRLDATP